jgi:hypothetical protein
MGFSFHGHKVCYTDHSMFEVSRLTFTSAMCTLTSITRNANPN